MKRTSSGEILGPVGQLLGERGRHDLVGAEPVVEVVAEPAGVHLGRKVAVRRGDDLALEGEGLGVAHPLESPRLEHTEQLHLDRRVELADLIEEDRAMLPALLQPAFPVLVGRRERPLDVSEQLRLDQGRGQGGEIERNVGVGLTDRESLVPDRKG